MQTSSVSFRSFPEIFSPKEWTLICIAIPLLSIHPALIATLSNAQLFRAPRFCHKFDEHSVFFVCQSIVWEFKKKCFRIVFFKTSQPPTVHLRYYFDIK